jgi:hypothetical protein
MSVVVLNVVPLLYLLSFSHIPCVVNLFAFVVNSFRSYPLLYLRLASIQIFPMRDY